MRTNFYLQDRDAVAVAAELVDEFGTLAADEAVARANASRDRGNVIHFCRWRQIGRLVEWMDSDAGEATIH